MQYQICILRPSRWLVKGYGKEQWRRKNSLKVGSSNTPASLDQFTFVCIQLLLISVRKINQFEIFKDDCGGECLMFFSSLRSNSKPKNPLQYLVSLSLCGLFQVGDGSECVRHICVY